MTISFCKKRFIVTTQSPNDQCHQILRPAFLTQVGSCPKMLKYGVPEAVFQFLLE